MTLFDVRKIYYVVIISFLAPLLSGCITRTHHEVDMSRVELIPRLVAQRIIEGRIGRISEGGVRIGGIIGSESCRKMSETRPISDLEAAVWGNNRFYRNALFLWVDHNQIKTCSKGILIQDISLSEAKDLVVALKALGAPIKNISVNTD